MATFNILPSSARTSPRARSLGGWLAALLLLGATEAVGQTPITNAVVLNVTPGSFSVLWSVSSPIGPGMTPSISVFSDSRAVTNLAGLLSVEFYPLDAGDPTLTTAYARRLNRVVLRQQSMNQGLVYVRVSGCAPNTTYYYRLQLSNPNGQPIVLPSTTPLPGITTARENAFVLQSQELLINLAGNNQNGSVVTLSNAISFYGLAAVVSDGAGTNQVFFSINDLIAATGNTNFAPLGAQQFTASESGLLQNDLSQIYALSFSTTFSIGQINQFSLGSFLAINIGSTAVRAGSAGGVSIGLAASGSLTNLSFILNVPTNRVGNLTLQNTSSQLGFTGLQPIGSNTFLISMAAVTGQNLQGTQTVAQLNFSTVSNQSSAFVLFSPQSPQGANADGSPALVSPGQLGRLVIVGSQPLLDATFAADGTRNLSLFGIPGTTYQVQYSTNLFRSNGWTGLLSVPMTNLLQVLSGLDATRPVIFYRARTP